jgi:hypothetical protein
MEYKVIEIEIENSKLKKIKRVIESFGYVENVNYFVFPKGDYTAVQYYVNK